MVDVKELINRPGVFLIILALLFFLIASSGVMAYNCKAPQITPCAWYDLLCHGGNIFGGIGAEIGYQACLANAFFWESVFRILGGLLLLVGVFKAIRGE